MKETDGSFLSPKDKRAAVERGEAVFYPWAGNAKSLLMNASDIMATSSSRYATRLDLAEGWAENPEVVHKAWIVPSDAREQPQERPTSDVIVIPEPQEGGA